MKESVPSITASQRYTRPPRWAVLERELIEKINHAIDPLISRYVNKDGSLKWPARADFSSVDGLDDAYESFHNWPLFYALGGAERFRELSFSEWEAITRQFEKYDCGHGHPMVVKEYEQGYDWFHQGEGYLMFFMLGLADADHEKTIKRAQRFAGFYMNEDPQAKNYDPKHRLVRCSHVGSMGPAFRNFDIESWGWADWKQYYGLPFQGVPGCDHLDSIKIHGNAVNMAKVMKERMSSGDVPVNLAITSLVTNACLYSAQPKYKDWVKEYIEAWINRTRDNNGIIPDNVGLNGKIGESNTGKWYGGYYGWTWPHGWLSLADPVTLAAENALLLFQDPSFLELPRSQMEILISHGIEQDGDLFVPYKYGDPGNYEYQVSDLILTTGNPPRTGSTYRDLLWRNGWFEFQPMIARQPVHLWFMSMENRDLERILRIRNRRKNDWNQIRDAYEKDQGGHDAAWVAYLNGEYPNYPEQILTHNITQVERRQAAMEQDTQDPQEYQDWYLQVRNPVTCEGLVRLTLGGPLPLYNGGHLLTTVRYFDIEKRRPGLPDDVAALVENIQPEKTGISLVNLNPHNRRTILVQAGSYGEHQFDRVREENANGNWIDIRGKYFMVVLEAGSQIRLELVMKRFVNSGMFANPLNQYGE